MAKCNCAVVLRWLLFLLLVAGFIFSAIAAASCSFMDYAGVSTGTASGGRRWLQEETDVADADAEPNDTYIDPDDLDADTDPDYPDEDSEEDEASGFDPDDADQEDQEPMTQAESESALTDIYGTSGQTGLYRYTSPDDGQCYHYPDDQTYDRSEEAARAGAAIAPMCAAAVAFFLLFECLFCRVPYCKAFLGLILLVGIICQGLTFLMLASSSFCNINSISAFYYEIRDEKPCTVSQGGVYSAFAVLFYFFALVILACAPKPDPICGKSSGIEKDSGTDFRNEDKHDWTSADVGSMT